MTDVDTTVEPDLMGALKDSLNPEAPDSSETQDPPAETFVDPEAGNPAPAAGEILSATRRRRAARSNGQPATTYEYLIFLDGENVSAVGEWEAEHAETTYFADMDGQLLGRSADYIDNEDLRHIATAQAATPDKAVDLLLADTGIGGSRAQVVRDAHADHVSIRFRVLTPGKVTEVPRVWEQRWALAGGGR